jgi:hypothetical protein
VSSSTPPTVYSEEAKAEKAEKLQADQAELERDAGKSSKAKKPEPLSNAAMAAIGAGATAAGAAGAAGVAKLAGKKAGIIERVIGKFTSKESKTPPTNALAKIKVPSEAEKLAELASSAAREKAAGAATPRRFAYQTDKIQTPRRTLPDTLPERAAAAAERSKARGGRIVRMASGGSVSAASSRADGIAQRGKTKFRIY